MLLYGLGLFFDNNKYMLDIVLPSSPCIATEV